MCSMRMQRPYSCSFVLPFLTDACSDAVDRTLRMVAEVASYESDKNLGSDAIVASWCGGSCGEDWAERISG